MKEYSVAVCVASYTAALACSDDLLKDLYAHGIKARISRYQIISVMTQKGIIYFFTADNVRCNMLMGTRFSKYFGFEYYFGRDGKVEAFARETDPTPFYGSYTDYVLMKEKEKDLPLPRYECCPLCSIYYATYPYCDTCIGGNRCRPSVSYAFRLLAEKGE